MIMRAEDPRYTRGARRHSIKWYTDPSPQPSRHRLSEAAPVAGQVLSAVGVLHDARAIERILQRDYPAVVPEPALGALSPRPEALGALDDTDPGSPHDYTLDSMPPTGGLDHDA